MTLIIQPTSYEKKKVGNLKVRAGMEILKE